MATFKEIKRLAQPAAAWFYAVAKDLRAEVYADPARFEREYDARSADWDKALEMYDGSTRLQPAAHELFATYVTMVAEQRPRVAQLLNDARTAASERTAGPREIHVITLTDAGESEIRVVDAASGRAIMTVPGVPVGPAGLDRAELKIRALLPDADSYSWHDDWSYSPTRREVRNVKRLWPAEQH
jgi:hypothetical protein